MLQWYEERIEEYSLGSKSLKAPSVCRAIAKQQQNEDKIQNEPSEAGITGGKLRRTKHSHNRTTAGLPDRVSASFVF